MITEYLTVEEFVEITEEDIEDIEKILKRANLDIFKLILINEELFTQYPEDIQFLVKLAVADQALYLSAKGIISTIDNKGGRTESVSIGDYSETVSYANSKDTITLDGYAASVEGWLLKTGLLNYTYNVTGGGWYG